MSERHLTSADPLPPLAKDTLRLYSMLYCPFAQRPRLVLEHKGVKYETVNIHLRDKPAWHLERNPNGTVPVLEINGKVLYESTVVMDYIDDIFTGPQLTPNHPYIRAKARILGEEFAKVVTSYYKLMRSSEEEKAANLENYHTLMGKFHSYMPNTKFLAGDELTMIDYVCWPFFERFLTGLSGWGLDLLPFDKYPKLQPWIETMENVPAVKATRGNPDHIIRFYKSFFGGTPDFDFAMKH